MHTKRQIKIDVQDFSKVVCSIKNYFGDKSGHHYRNKNYIYKEGVLYKLDCNQGIEVKRVTKELSGILTNIGYQRSI